MNMSEAGLINRLESKTDRMLRDSERSEEENSIVVSERRTRLA